MAPANKIDEVAYKKLKRLLSKGGYTFEALQSKTGLLERSLMRYIQKAAEEAELEGKVLIKVGGRMPRKYQIIDRSRLSR